MGLQKAVKPEFGGGSRSFSCEEDYIYENIESELCFFTSQVIHCIEQQTVESFNTIKFFCFQQRCVISLH